MKISRPENPIIFVHTVVVGGTVYKLYLEQAGPEVYSVMCINLPGLPQFHIGRKRGRWHIANPIPDKQQFENLLNLILHEKHK